MKKGPGEPSGSPGPPGNTLCRTRHAPEAPPQAGSCFDHNLALGGIQQLGNRPLRAIHFKTSCATSRTSSWGPPLKPVPGQTGASQKGAVPSLTPLGLQSFRSRPLIYIPFVYVPWITKFPPTKNRETAEKAAVPKPAQGIERKVRRLPTAPKTRPRPGMSQEMVRKNLVQGGRGRKGRERCKRAAN